MASEQLNVDEGPAPDPFEAELVAYLDGELDEAAARRVEARLERDPAARTRAAELRKSFAMLDFLPKPEPSPTFTTRTLDKLPAVKAPKDTPPRTRDSDPVAKPVGAALSTSMPIPLDSGPRATGRHRLLLWGGLVGLVALFGLIGYGAGALVRPDSRDQSGAEPVEVAPRVVENLPLYAVADNIEYVTELGKSDYFGDDPAVVFDTTLRAASNSLTEKPVGAKAEELTRAFRELPPARRAEIVKLDAELYAKQSKERERLLRVLEAYSAWLARLPDDDRARVFGAATPAARLGQVRAIRERQWLDTLPAAVRARPELIRQWREQEENRRDRLAFIRQHSEAFAANKSPWPFDTEAGRKGVIDFARAAFKVDDVRRCRLSLPDLGEYRRTLSSAERDGTWAWYGLLVYELNRTHPYLPESDNTRLMMTEVNDLPEPYQSRANPKKGFGPRPRLGSVGKWPEFPLEVLREVSVREVPFMKGPPPPLGPSRLIDMKPPVREFATKELFPKMTGDEKRDLQSHAGKWPDYPQRLIHYANKYDLSIPGVMPPGSPRKWEETYGIHFRSKP